MKLLSANLVLGVLLVLTGCSEYPWSPKNSVGTPDEGMTQEELLDAAEQQISTYIVGHLEVGPNKHRIPLRWAGVWTDEQAQTEEEFAISLGRVMRAMSARVEVEFCAQICRREDTWGAAIITIDSGRYCPNSRLCPSNRWASEGHPIHSHRRSGPYQATPQDEALRTGTLRPTREIHLEAERASKEDIKLGGWMVGQDGLWFIDEQGGLNAVWDYGREQKGMPARIEQRYTE